MSFLMRGRPPWWLRDQTHPHASEPAPEPVAQATGLPVAAPAPADGTDDLRASDRLSQTGVLQLDERHLIETARCNCCDGTLVDRLWVDAELKSLERLAALTTKHGPWEAAARMWAPVPKPTAASNATYWATLRGQR